MKKKIEAIAVRHFSFAFCNVGENMQLSSHHLQSKYQIPVNFVW